MKAPDKVYVKKEKDNVTYSLSIQYDNGGEQYIRKEALMEWLEDNAPVEASVYGFMGGYMAAYKQVIDKLNSM